MSAPRTSETWFKRNWMWVVPLGCLGPILFVILVVMMALSFLKKTTPYTAALAKAQADCEVRSALGAPVTAGWSVAGSANVSASSGHADLSFPLAGPRAKGTLYITATKSAGLWRFDMLQLAVAGRAERIDLLAQNRPACE